MKKAVLTQACLKLVNNYFYTVLKKKDKNYHPVQIQIMTNMLQKLLSQSPVYRAQFLAYYLGKLQLHVHNHSRLLKIFPTVHKTDYFE